MKKVLIYYRQWSSSLGGGEVLPLIFVADFQKRGWDVTLALDRSHNLRHVTQFLGVPIDLSRLKIVLTLPGNKLFRRIDTFIPVFKTHRLKKIAKDVDICISAFNTSDFGRPAHHFICGLKCGDSSFFRYVAHEKTTFLQHICHILTNHFLRPVLRVRSFQSIVTDRREHIYPNSRYVESLLQSYYGPFTGTLFYPPTIFEFHQKDVRRNPLSVVFIGRIAEGKRLPDIISIVEQARSASGMDLELFSAGKADRDAYMDEIKRLSRGKEWIRFVGTLYGEKKEDFLLSATYAVHAERDEAFGISITEYLKAGCIPIVPDEGGTPEIVCNPALIYHTNKEAAQILVRLLSDGTFREEQRNYCLERAKTFSFGNYMKMQHELIDKMLKEQA
jgi:glycosyltransferase involved in cell wall biosynthesis